MFTIPKGLSYKRIRITDTDGKIYEGPVVFITRAPDDDEMNRDSITIAIGERYVCFYDHEIAGIEITGDITESQ